MTSARLIIYSGAAALGGIIGYAFYRMETKDDEKVYYPEVAGGSEEKSESKDVDSTSEDDVVKLMERFCICELSVKWLKSHTFNRQ